MSKKTQLTQEFIGRNVEILESKCKSQNKICGKIIDETKNTLSIRTETGNKKLLKNQIKFKLSGQTFWIDGNEIAKHPEERLKMRIKNE